MRRPLFFSFFLVASSHAFSTTRHVTTRFSTNTSPSTETRTSFLLRRKTNSHAPNRRHAGPKPLAASPLVSVLSSPVGSLAVLATIVLIHECGHYFAARSFGIKVEEFSVGVGPKIVGFSAFGNAFSLRALPLGGYVKFPENYNATLAREIAIADEKAFAEYIRQQQLGVGSQLLNAVTLGAVVDNMWSEEKERRKQEVEKSGGVSTPELWWQKIINPKKKNAATSAIEFAEIEYYEDPQLLQNRPWPERAVVLSGGVVFNLLLAFFIYFGQIGFGPGLPEPVFNAGVVVSSQPKPEAPATGILRQGDVIVGINGQPVTLSQSPTALESNRAINDFIMKVRNTPDGGSLTLDVLRGGRTSESPVEVSVVPKRSSSASDNGPQTIGVLLSPNYIKSELIKSDSPLVAASLATNRVTALTLETARGLGQFFTSIVAGGGSGANQVSGPIGLIKAGSDVVATKDLTTVLLFAAAISINLGVVNALPIPALDGGQLMFVLAEALTGRKVDQRVEESVTGVAVLFLILLSVSTLFGDISSIFFG